jgi:hypothetical protein
LLKSAFGCHSQQSEKTALCRSPGKLTIPLRLRPVEGDRMRIWKALCPPKMFTPRKPFQSCFSGLRWKLMTLSTTVGPHPCTEPGKGVRLAPLAMAVSSRAERSDARLVPALSAVEGRPGRICGAEGREAMGRSILIATRPHSHRELTHRKQRVRGMSNRNKIQSTFQLHPGAGRVGRNALPFRNDEAK